MNVETKVMSWKYFAIEEFNCKGTNCCDHDNRMIPDFIDRLDELRERCGFPLSVTSGYRCPEHNQRVSTTGPNGPHTTGFASDFGISHERAHILLGHAMALDFKGIGINQKGSSRFIHLDDLMSGPRPHVWSY